MENSLRMIHADWRLVGIKEYIQQWQSLAVKPSVSITSSKTRNSQAKMMLSSHFSPPSTHLNPSPQPPQSCSQPTSPQKIYPDRSQDLICSSRPEILSNYQKHDSKRSENKISLQIIGSSKFLNMIELPRILKRLPQALPIFDVTRVVADARVENIIHRMTSKEEIADYSEDLAIGRLRPESAQVCNGVDHLLLAFHHKFEAVKWELMLLEQPSNLPLVLLDEGNYALSEVFWDVLGLILRSSLHFGLLFGLLGNFLCFESLHFFRVLPNAKDRLL